MNPLPGTVMAGLPGLVTVTESVLGISAGDLAVMVVALTTTTLVPAPDPNATAAPLTNPVPVMVTAVPPAAGPEVGLMVDANGHLAVVAGEASAAHWLNVGAGELLVLAW